MVYGGDNVSDQMRDLDRGCHLLVFHSRQARPTDMDVMGSAHSDTGSAIAQDKAGQLYSDSDIDHWARCDTSWPVKHVNLDRQGERDISSRGSDSATSYGTDRDFSSRGSNSATSYGTDDSRGAADHAWREMTGQDILDDNSSCGSARIRKVRGRNRKDKPADLARVLPISLPG